MHFQQSQTRRVNETLLYNDAGYLPKPVRVMCLLCNKNTIITPPLSEQLLPGITRGMLLDILKADGHLRFERACYSHGRSAQCG